MARTLLASSPPIEIASQWRRNGKGPHDDVEVRVAYALCHVPVMTRMLDGVEFSEFRVTALAEGYRVMVKGTRGKHALVSFYYGDTFRDVLACALTHLDTGRAYWVLDDYPVKRQK